MGNRLKSNPTVTKDPRMGYVSTYKMKPNVANSANTARSDTKKSMGKLSTKEYNK